MTQKQSLGKLQSSSEVRDAEAEFRAKRQVTLAHDIPVMTHSAWFGAEAQGIYGLGLVGNSRYTQAFTPHMNHYSVH